MDQASWTHLILTLQETGFCNFITQMRKWWQRAQRAVWDHTSANTGPGFKPRPSRFTVCMLHPPPEAPLVLVQVLSGVNTRTWSRACETLAWIWAHTVFYCHHPNAPNQWFCIWWLWKRRNMGAFVWLLLDRLPRSSWSRCPRESTITTISVKDLEMWCWPLLQSALNLIAQLG